MEFFIGLTISNFLYIVILLILAGISIAQLTGNGLFKNAKLAKEKSDNAQRLENDILLDYEKKINESMADIITDGNRESANTKSKILFEGNQSSGKITFEDDKISNYDSFEFIFGVYGTTPGDRRLLTQTVSKDFLELPSVTGDIKYISQAASITGIVAILIDSVDENSIEFRTSVTGASWSNQTGEIYKIIGRKN